MRPQISPAQCHMEDETSLYHPNVLPSLLFIYHVQRLNSQCYSYQQIDFDFDFDKELRSTMSSEPSQRTNDLEATLWNMSDFPDLLDFVTSNRHSRHASIAVDWKETPEAHIFEADIPGLSKEDVKIQVDEGQRVLQISGERALEEPVDEKNKVHRFERPHGSFLRRFLLPKNARLHEEVKAKMENGVLTLTILKKPDQESRIRSIQISVEREERGK